MWKCKHCNKTFDFKTTSEKANHSRWCDENPKGKDTSNLKIAAQKSLINRFGKIKDFNVKCNNCDIMFSVEEREKKFPTKSAYYCSRSCANSRGGNARSRKREELGILSYGTIAKKYHKQECIVCGFTKVLDIHHIDHNHDNNVKENLVFLCPNHHRMVHSKYKNEILPYIKKYIMGL